MSKWSPIDITPLHDFVGSPAAISGAKPIGFNSDDLLVVEAQENYPELWSIAVYHWPEVLATMLLITTLAIVVLFIRIKHRPQVVGSPHCRKCCYVLDGVPTRTCCPECGTDPVRRHPTIGRSTLRRMSWPLTFLLLFGLGYGALHASRVGRVNAAAEWLHIVSPAVTDYARQHQIRWIQLHDRPWMVITLVDPDSGRIVATLRRSSSGRLHRSFSLDRRIGILQSNGGRMEAIDLTTGRAGTSLTALDNPTAPSVPPPTSWRDVVGWADAENVYVQQGSARPEDAALDRWSIPTGKLTRISQLHAPVGDPSMRLIKRQSSVLVAIPGTTPLQAVEVPPRGPKTDYGSPSTLRVINLADGSLVREITDNFWTEVLPVPRGEGTFFIRVWGDGDDIALWSLNGDRREGGMKSPGFMGTLQDGPAGLAFNTATGRLFVATSSDAVYVRDTAKKNWIARLQYNLSKQTLPDDHVVTSSDGRWVAIAVTDCAPRTTSPSSVPGGPPAASTMQFVPHLLIFDLKSLNLPPVAPR